MTQTITAPEQVADAVVGARVIPSDVLDISPGDPLTRCAFTTTTEGKVRVACGAQSFIRAVFASGELFACGHHGHKNMDALRAQALEIYDQRGAINVKPSMSANAE